MATFISTGALQGHDGAESVSNYISQINAGGTVYDIATHHGITFYAGSSDSTGTKWNGLTDLQVIIPSVADLVQNPVEYVGNIGSDGQISYHSEMGTNYTPNKGDLLYVTADCTFNSTSCQAGDMAIYDGTAWQIVSGENQVEIVGIGNNNDKTFTLTAAADSVLTVAGKTLKLNVDYTGVKDFLSVAKNTLVSRNLVSGSVTVASAYVALSKASKNQAIGESKTIAVPTALSNGAVTINESVLVSSNFVFGAGSLASAASNTAAITLDVSSSVALTKDSTGNDFVSYIGGDILGNATIVSASVSSEAELAYIGAVNVGTSTSKYVNGIETLASNSDKTADLTVKEYSISGVSTFYSGWSNPAATGEVLSSITLGNVTVSTGSDVVTGLKDGSDIITSVGFGTVVSDSASSWFVSGLKSGSDVVTGVTAISSATLVSDSSSSFTSSALTSASVSDHVLTFGSANFMTPVKVDTLAATVTTSGFAYSGVKLSGQTVSSKSLAMGGLVKPTVTPSYKSLIPGTVGITASDVKYAFTKESMLSVSATTSYAKMSLGYVVVSTGSYSVSGSVAASIPANKVLTTFTSGSLPTFSITGATGTLTGTVGTSLSTSDNTFYAVAAAASNISLDTYTLVSDNSVAGGLAVAAASTYSVSGKIEIPADTYVTAVYVSDTAVSKKA